MTQAQRYRGIIDYFSREMPAPKTELHYRTPYELLVAVMLSAQCTDKRVNMVTPALFSRFPTVAFLSEITEEDLLPFIASISYPNSKAKHLVAMARMIVKDYAGELPTNRDELMKLPGVGRKTANVLASVLFGQPTMAVDTHVFRVANRIGLTNSSRTPLETERELIRFIPRELVPDAHHWLILHGRYVCRARKPLCEGCGIATYCRYAADKENISRRETM